MKKLYLFFLILLNTGLFIQPTRASHIAALDLSLTCIGGFDYLVTFVLYRDCSGISAGQTISLDFQCTSTPSLNFTSTNIPLLAWSGQSITPNCPLVSTTCSNPQGTLYGLEEYIYQTQVTLTPCNKWVVSWTTCCRNPSNTINSPTSQSAYIEATLNNMAAPSSSTPLFTNLPMTILCSGQANYINNGVIDLDGDSLVTSLVTPFNYNNTTFVTYLPPYSATQPLASNPPVTLNPLNGEACFTPTMNLITVMSFKVEKWRKIFGIPTLISTVYRDQQVNVINCSSFIPDLAGMDTTLVHGYDPNDTVFYNEFCVGNPIEFAIWGHDNDTFNASSFGSPEKFSLFWNNTIQQASFQSYNQGTDSAHAVFSWTPTSADIREAPYCFLAWIRDQSCPYNLFHHKMFCIKVIGLYVDIGPDTAICSGSSLPVQAVADSNTVNYYWSVNGTPVLTPTSSSNYLFNTYALQPGPYIISVETYGNNPNTVCPGKDQMQVDVMQSPSLFLGNDTTVGLGSYFFLDAGAGYAGYSWSTGSGAQSIVVDTTGTGQGTAMYWVVVTDSNGCQATDTILVHFVPNPGIDELPNESFFSLFPNPNDGRTKIYIKHFPGNEITLEIYRSDGTRAYQSERMQPAEDGQFVIEPGFLADGLYLVKVTGKNRVLTRKLVVKRDQ